MDSNIERDECLDDSYETLERRRNYRTVSLDACLKGPVPTVDREFDCRQEADNSLEDRFAVAIYGDMQSSTCTYKCLDTYLVIFCMYSLCS